MHKGTANFFLLGRQKFFHGGGGITPWLSLDYGMACKRMLLFTFSVILTQRYLKERNIKRSERLSWPLKVLKVMGLAFTILLGYTKNENVKQS